MRTCALALLAAAAALPLSASAERQERRGPQTLSGRPHFFSSYSGGREAVTLPPFNKVVDNVAGNMDLDPDPQLLTPPPGTYNVYTVSVDWSPLAGQPWSSEAIWAFTDTDNLATVTTFYADPDSAPNSADNSTPATLTWSGVLDTDYNTANGPLYMLMAQQFEGSSANWNNVTVTLDNIVLPPIVVTNFTGNTAGDPTFNRPATLTTLSSLATAVPYEVIPFYVSASGSYDFETAQGFDGYPLLYSGSFSASAPLTNLKAVLDLGFEGEPDGGSVVLTAGTQYYLVMSGYENSDFGPFAGSISNSRGVAGSATLGLVPEPTTASGLVLLGLIRRGRRA